MSASPLTSGLIDDELALRLPTRAVELEDPDPAAVVLEPCPAAVVVVVLLPCPGALVVVVVPRCVDTVVPSTVTEVVVPCPVVVVVSCATVVVVSPTLVVVPPTLVVVVVAAVLVVVACDVLVVVACAVVVDCTDDEVVPDWVDEVGPACEVLVAASVDEEVVVVHACAVEPPEASSTPSGPITANAPATNTGVSRERTIPPRHTGQNGARFALAPRQASDHPRIGGSQLPRCADDLTAGRP